MVSAPLQPTLEITMSNPIRIRIRFLGTHVQDRKDGSGSFYSFAFAKEDGSVFSLSANSDKLAGVDAGATFEVSGLAFEPALDAAGAPLRGKNGQAILTATRDGDADVDLRFIRNGGFRVHGLPGQQA